MAKTMYQAGWSSSVLKEWFSVGAQTICNWDKVPTPEALKYFEENLKMAMADFDMNASYKVKERILELLPDERNIDKLVKAGEFFDKTSINKKTQQNTQVNVYSDLIKKFQPEGWDK